MSSSSNSKKVAILAIVVGNNDEPIFLKDLRGVGQNPDDINNSDEYLFQFILHSSLDMVSERQWQSSNIYLGVVDTFREYSVTAWISVSGVKFLLLHRGHSEPSIKAFLKTLHTLWIKLALNPLQDRQETIINPAFDSRVLTLANKYLGNQAM
jgi:hypothetical protein